MTIEEQFKLTAKIKTMFRELTAYRAFAMMAKLNGFTANIEGEGILGVDEMLESARNSPALDAWVEKHFISLEVSLGLVDEALFLEALREALRQWKPSGQPN